MSMLRAKVNHSHEQKVVEMDVIKEAKHMKGYKEKHPIMYPLVKDYFTRELAQGETILVNSKGGWCTEVESMKIVEYIN